MTNLITIADPQVLEMQALDEAFYKWLDDEASNTSCNLEEQNYWADRWADIDYNALVFTSENYDYDVVDAETGENSAMELAMSRDMDTRIRAKREIIYRINHGG